jgi:hypothetical protein
MTRLGIALAAAAFVAGSANAIELDPKIVGFTLPDADGKEQRMPVHPNDRFFMVLSGTWWVGNGGKFDPEATVPMPAGTHVIHWAKGVHYDGAKTEPATIVVWGEGPATSTPFVAAENMEKK